jgi:transposase
MNHRWTITEINFIRIMYINFTRKDIAEKLGVSELKVRDTMKRYGISKPMQKPYRKWTPDEIEIIRRNYGTTSAKLLAAILGTTTHILWATVQRYGLTKRKRRRKHEHTHITNSDFNN